MSVIAAAPVTTVTITGLAMAWGRGWPPAKLRRAAAWSLPMPVAYLAVTAVTTRSPGVVLAAPFSGWSAITES